MMADPAKAVRGAALRFLARREYADTELQTRLQKAGFALSDIQPVLATLIAENLLSNTRFIQNYIHFRRNKGFGPLRIAAEFSEKGLSPEEYEIELQTESPAWLTDIRIVWEKKFKKQSPADYHTQAKQMRFLQSRGFTGEQIQALFKHAITSID